MPQSDDLRFPIGRFNPATESSRTQQIDAIRQLPTHLRAAVAGLSDAQLDTPYRDGGWTVRQVVHHLADSHANAFARFKLALTEDWPTIKPYDEAAWAELADSKQPIGLSLDLLTGLHARWVALRESMSDEDFQRGYNHPAMGRQELSRALAIYAWHGGHHIAHITNLRTRMGW